MTHASELRDSRTASQLDASELKEFCNLRELDRVVVVLVRLVELRLHFAARTKYKIIKTLTLYS